jgi:Family of unknown function (DUF6338)
VPDTFESLGVLLLALLPGATYLWTFERYAGRWGISLPDRVFRFVGISALFHAIAAPGTYALWHSLVRSGRWDDGGLILLAIWPVLLAYAGLPAAAGALVGRAVRRHRAGEGKRAAWIEWVTGPAPAPRAWDALFFGQPGGWILLKLKSGGWIGGELAAGSYAAGYPESQDLYVASAAEVDPETGEFVFEDGKVKLRSSGILVRWDEVEYLEIIPSEEA